MEKRPLVWTKTVVLLVTGFLLAAASPLRAQITGGVFGDVIPLPGHINEVIIDEARGLVYAGNFSAGTVEVVSMATNQRISTFIVSPQPAAVSDIAMSMDGRYLVATIFPVTNSTPRLSGLTIVNLNDPSDRRHFAMTEQPLAITFTATGKAIVATTRNLQLLDPLDGSLELMLDFDGAEGVLGLPVTGPAFPREILTATLASSPNGKWVYGLTSGNVFSFEVIGDEGFMTARDISGLVNQPAFPHVSVSEDGSWAMMGQLLFNRRMGVVADTPHGDATTELIGGSVIDAGIDTVYAAFEPVDAPTPPAGTLPNGVLFLMDMDNLKLRRRIRLPEEVTGGISMSRDGQHLYAVSQSGIMNVPLGRLGEYPMLEINVFDRFNFFQFDFCNRAQAVKTIRLETSNGQPVNFKIDVDTQFINNRQVALFEPHQGTAPAEIRMTVDAGVFGPVQGTTILDFRIETDAINIPFDGHVVGNLKNVDQKGILHPVDGLMVDILADPVRDRVYALDQANFRVLVFDENFRVSGTFRTGNTPTWMTISRDGSLLLIANSRSETLSVIDLIRLRPLPPIFFPWPTLGEGFYPRSLATDNSTILAVAKGATGGRIALVNPQFRAVTMPESLGIFENRISEDTGLSAAPNGSGILMAEPNGRVQLWDAQSSRVILSRNDLGAISGAVGHGPGYFIVGSNLLNSSLVPIKEFPDGAASQTGAGFAVLPNGVGVRSLRPINQLDSGAVQKLDSRDPRRALGAVRLVDQPPPPPGDMVFSRTLTALRDGRLASTSSAGIVELSAEYDLGLATPRIAGVTNAADFTTNLGSGGLISIFGDNLSTDTAIAGDSPLPGTLGNVCVTVNGANLPLLFVSPTQINAQLQFSSGIGNTVVHSPGGISNVFVSEINSAAPAVFSVSGPNNSRFAAVLRAKNNLLATLSNPLRHNEVAVIYATGLGDVVPVAVAGAVASSVILSETVNPPTVTVGGAPADVQFAGLAPGFVGLYQINVLVPITAPLGLEVPMTITAGGVSTTVNIRIVD